MPPESSDIVLSLIVATLGRTQEVERLFSSLAAQTIQNFEVIVVDQNNDDRLGAIVSDWSDKLPIIWKRAERRGVCRARNLGAAHARGQWLLFPDDDCWYPSDFISRFDQLQAAGNDFFSGRPTDVDGNTIMGTFEETPTVVDRKTVWTTLIEWALIIRRSAFEDVGGFDEAIGPGANTHWGAYEAQDIALRLMAAGYRGYYDPTLVGHHPQDLSDRTSPANVAKIRTYSMGMGYVMRKHGYSARYFLPRLMRPLMGIALYTLSCKWGMAKRSLAIFSGRLFGWRHAPV